MNLDSVGRDEKFFIPTDVWFLSIAIILTLKPET